MVEEIEVKLWNTITINSGMMYWIRLLNEGDLQRIVQQYNIPFIFVRKKEKMAIHEHCLYWYKP